MEEIYTLYTRSNFDGLVCATLLKEIGLVDNIKFVHPKDIQDSKIELSKNAITAGLPYTEGVYIAFDHHSSELKRTPEQPENYIIEPTAPSSARVIYEYFGGEDRFDERLAELLKAVDIADCSNFTEEDIFNPKGWVLLNYIMDARTGFGRHKTFRISNLELMYKLIDLLLTKSIEEILEDPDVKERVDLYFKEQEQFVDQLKRCSRKENKIIILDVRNEDPIYTGNRFMIYAHNPDCNISIHIMWGLNKSRTVFAVGKSIVNKSCPIDLGSMLYENFQGGGHINAGTCQVDNEKADETLYKLIEIINKENFNE